MHHFNISQMSKGFFVPSMGMSLLVLGMLTIAGLGLALKVQSSRLEACKANYELTVRLGKEQEAKTKETITRQKGNTDSVRNDYRAALAELNRLRDKSGSGHVPTPGNDTESTDGATGESRPDCTGLKRRAGNDALKLWYWQDLARKQGWPVE